MTVLFTLHIALWIIGFHRITRKGKIFGFVSEYFSPGELDEMLKKEDESHVQHLMEFMNDVSSNKKIEDVAMELHEKTVEILSDIAMMEEVEEDKGLVRKILLKLSPAISECLVCMSSLHTALAFILIESGLHEFLLIKYVVLAVSCAGIVSILCSIGSIPVLISEISRISMNHSEID